MMDNIFANLVANNLQPEDDPPISGHPLSLFRKMHDTVVEILEEISIIAKHYRGLDLPPLDHVITLQTTKTVPISARSRRYNLIFVPNNTTQISVAMPGLGNVAFTPPVGWTELNFADGTELSLVTGSDQNIILRATNIPLGANAL